MLQARRLSHYAACSTSVLPTLPNKLSRRRVVCISRAGGPDQATAAASTNSTSKHLQQTALAAAVLGVSSLAAAHPEAANALTIHMEPSNALSVPTWAIHVSSVTEWIAAMALMWKYAEVSGNARWKGMTWGMMPALGSAMAACTWHFFYNSPGEPSC